MKWSDLAGIFYQPAAVFERQKEKPTWLVPLIIIVLVGIAVFLIIWKPIVMPEQIQKIMANDNIPAEGKDKVELACVQARRDPGHGQRS